MHTYHRLLSLPHHKSRYLSLFFLIATMRTFVLASLNLFLPVLLIANLQHFGHSSQNSLMLAGMIFLFMPITHGLLTVSVSVINHKFGIKTGFLIGQIFLILFLFLLGVNNLIVLIIAFIFWGIASAFWWTTYHTFFLEIGKTGEIGRELGLVQILGVLTGLIAPVVGGILILYFGQSYLYIFNAGVVIASIFCLVLVKDFEKIPAVNFCDLKNEITSHRADFTAYIGAGGEEITYSVIWPILLFSVIKNYLAVGILSSSIILISVFITYFVACLSDKLPKNRLEKIGSGTVASTWLGRMFFQTPFGMVVIDSLYRIFFNGFYSVPLDALAYSHANRDNKARYVVFREFAYRIGNVIVLLLFIGLVAIGLPFWLIFSATAFFSLLPMIMRE